VPIGKIFFIHEPLLNLRWIINAFG
jgi:hypothetical protein